MKKILLLLILSTALSFCMENNGQRDSNQAYKATVHIWEKYSKQNREKVIGEVFCLPDKPLDRFEQTNGLRKKSLCFQGKKVQSYRSVFSIPEIKYAISPEGDAQRPFVFSFSPAHPLLFSDKKKNLYIFSARMNSQDPAIANVWLHQVTAIHLLVERMQKDQPKE